MLDCKTIELTTNAKLIGEAEGYRYYLSQNGKIIKAKYQDHFNFKEMTIQNKIDLLSDIISDFDIEICDFDIAVIKGRLNDEEKSDRSIIQDIANYFNNLDYPSIAVDSIISRKDSSLQDLDLLNSQYTLINVQKDFLDGCVFVINLYHRPEFMEDCFCLTEKYDTGFILKQKERKGAMLYKNNFYLKEFRSLFIPNFNWFSRVNIKFIHSDGIYLFEDFL